MSGEKMIYRGFELEHNEQTDVWSVRQGTIVIKEFPQHTKQSVALAWVDSHKKSIREFNS